MTVGHSEAPPVIEYPESSIQYHVITATALPRTSCQAPETSHDEGGIGGGVERLGPERRGGPLAVAVDLPGQVHSSRDTFFRNVATRYR